MTKPEFLDLNTEHYHGFVSATEFDYFYYGFYLKLNDADFEEPIQANLQGWNPGSGNWEYLAADPLTYTGIDTIWEDNLYYDILPLAVENGMIGKVRIECICTLKDGSDGTVYSDSLEPLYRYKGEYVECISSEMKGNLITSQFRVNKSLVNPSQLTMVDCTLWCGMSYWEIPSSSVSGPDADGIYTVTYDASGASLKKDYTCYVTMTLLDYETSSIDGDCLIEWYSSDWAPFVPVIAPTLSLEFDDEEGYPGNGITGALKLNDLQGGHATITLYRKNGGSFVPASGEYSKEEYSSASEVYDGSYYFGLEDSYLTDSGAAVRCVEKVVVEYSYPDGTTGRLESPEFNQYAGDYAAFATTPPFSYDPESKSFIAEIALDLSLVDTGGISVDYSHVFDEYWNDLGAMTLSSSSTDGRLVFTMPYEGFSPGNYSVDIMLIYYSGYGPKWGCSVYQQYYVD